MKAFIYTPKLASFSYGPGHPFIPRRMSLTHELIRAYGLLEGEGATVMEPEPATEKDLLSWHSPDYVKALRRSDKGEPSEEYYRYGLGTGDNPVFHGLFRYTLLYTGATLAAAGIASEGKAEASFNMAGGLHHAHAGRASGFCYVNDIVLGIKRLLEVFDRVLYVDIDAHHGDGVQEAFYDSNRVLTVSFHESGHYLFPGTGFETEMGVGEGKGFAVNFPFLPGAGDDLYLESFRRVVGPAVERFRPQAVVAQMGADGLRNDPLAHLSLSNLVHREVTGFLLATGVPLVALGGGGYDLDNVARVWTLVWAAIIGAEPPDRLPEPYLRARQAGAGAPLTLRDRPIRAEAPARLAEDARRVGDFLLERVIPLVNARGKRK